jgi:hypothetical protein
LGTCTTERSLNKRRIGAQRQARKMAAEVEWRVLCWCCRLPGACRLLDLVCGRPINLPRLLPCRFPPTSLIFFCPVSLIASSRAVRLRDAFLFNLWRLEESAAAVPRCERNRDTVQASECPRSCSARTRGHARRGRPRVGRAMGAADVVTHHRWMDGPRG